MKYHFKIYRDEDGLRAECVELKGCITQSEKDTDEDLFNNMHEALNLYLDEPDPDRVYPLPNPNFASGDPDAEYVEVPVDPKIAFALILKHERKAEGLSQVEVARRMGFKSVWAYQKLEKPSQTSPRLETVAKIKKVFADFDLNKVFA